MFEEAEKYIKQLAEQALDRDRVLKEVIELLEKTVERVDELEEVATTPKKGKVYPVVLNPEAGHKYLKTMGLGKLYRKLDENGILATVGVQPKVLHRLVDSGRLGCKEMVPGDPQSRRYSSEEVKWALGFKAGEEGE